MDAKRLDWAAVNLRLSILSGGASSIFRLRDGCVSPIGGVKLRRAAATRAVQVVFWVLALR